MRCSFRLPDYGHARELSVKQDHSVVVHLEAKLSLGSSPLARHATSHQDYFLLGSGVNFHTHPRKCDRALTTFSSESRFGGYSTFIPTARPWLIDDFTPPIA